MYAFGEKNVQGVLKTIIFKLSDHERKVNKLSSGFDSILGWH